MGKKERERIFAKLQEGMTEEEYQTFQNFKKNGNKHLEKEECEVCSPWTINFLTFLNMLQVFGGCVSRMDFSKPFRTVIDYDPEQVRVVIHSYFTDRCVSKSSQEETE